eukprot:4452654-Prymnesium_polylepis.1
MLKNSPQPSPPPSPKRSSSIGQLTKRGSTIGQSESYWERWQEPLQRYLSDAVTATIQREPTNPVEYLGLQLVQLGQQAENSTVQEVKEQAKILVTMDPGQDLDDEMFLVMLSALSARGAANLSS